MEWLFHSSPTYKVLGHSPPRSQPVEFRSPTHHKEGTFPHSMKFLLMPALLLFGLCTAALAAESPSSPVLPPAVVVPPEVHQIAPDQVVRQLVDHQDTLIIDVRTEDERHTRGYILNSLNFDYFHGQKTLDNLAKLDKTKPCIVYCAIGGRAELIAIQMHQLGFKNILLLKGGFNAWTATGQGVAK